MLAGAYGGGGWAQTPVTPKPGPGDTRIREVYYDRNAVVRVEGRLGYEMMIEFNPSEHIENVSIGDALAWQVSPNRKATLLFLKPMAKARDTSMTVVTSDHVYSFLLTVGDHAQMLRLRFLYLPSPPLPPPPAPPPPPPPPVLNRDYSSSGSNRFVPVSVFDDGTSTFFQFDPAKGIPAVLFVAPDGGEETANTRMAGLYTVVDLTAETFVIRYGNTKTELHNKAWSRRPLPRPAPYPSTKGE
jgi:type IV secretion system protein VirB9